MPVAGTRKELKASFKKLPIDSVLFGAVLTGVCSARCAVKDGVLNSKEIVSDALEIYYELETQRHMDKYDIHYYDGT